MQALAETHLAQAGSPEHGEHWSTPPEMVDRIAALAATAAHHRVPVGGPARRLHDLAGCEVVALGAAAHLAGASFTRHAARVLRRGGLLAITEAFWDGNRRLRLRWAAPQPRHPLTAGDLVDALRAAGFAEVRVLPRAGADPTPDDEVRQPELRADLLDGTRLMLARAR